MANPLLSLLGLGQNNQNDGMMANLGVVSSLYKMVRGSANPQEALNQLAKTNPNVANTLTYIQQNGGDMNKIANDLANQAGMPLQTILAMFK